MSEEHTRRTALHWRRILAEGTAIVLSILLAFGIEAWWSGSRERGDEQELLTALYEELGVNEALLTENVQILEDQSGLLRTLLAMSPAEVAAIPPDSVNDQVLTLFRRTFSSELAVGSLNSAMSSGNIALIRGSDIRSGLAQYEARNRDVAEVGAAVVDVTVAATVALGRYPEFTEAVARLPDSRGVPVSEATLMAIRSDSEIVGLLSAKAFFWSLYATELEGVLDELRAVRALIGAAREPGVR